MMQLMTLGVMKGAVKLCWGEFLDNTEIRRYVLLSNVCLNV